MADFARGMALGILKAIEGQPHTPKTRYLKGWAETLQQVANKRPNQETD